MDPVLDACEGPILRVWGGGLYIGVSLGLTPW